MPTLTWTGKEDALRAASLVPFRLLEPHRAAEGGIAREACVGDPEAAQDNLLIQGDNLEALKALLPYYAGRVKCIYIDPPYNTGSAFEHYDDNLEHSTWLSMMYPRLELLRELLSEDGSIWVNLDDGEAHYLKAIGDEIIGRSNFITNVIWEKSDSPRMDAEFFSSRHDHILVWARNIKCCKLNRLDISEEKVPEHYGKVDSSGRQYYLKPLRAMGGQGETRESRPNLYYPLVAPDSKEVYPIRPNGTDGAWRWGREKVSEEGERIEWVLGRSGWVPYFRIYADQMRDRPPETVWSFEQVGSNRTSKAEIKKLFPDSESFSTPKPEKLIRRIIEIATHPGDLVLDSFLGSGTTAAVAHKMGRRWIGIEMGKHAVTHCLPRLQKVIDGEQGGISEAVGWKGGGGFRFVELGETLFDAYGRLNPKVRFPDLAAFVWWRETKAPAIGDTIKSTSPFLGVHEGRGLYLLYNGILGDKRPAGGNALTPAVLASLPKHDGPRVIYAEATTYSPSSLARMNIIFKQIPYDLGSMPLLAEGALEYAAGLAPEASRTQSADEEGDHV